jgi:hypothetical protein
VIEEKQGMNMNEGKGNERQRETDVYINEYEKE